MAYLLSGDRFAAARRVKPGTPASPSTRKGFICSLSSFYLYLVLLELIELDPTVGVPRPKIKVKRGLCLSANELQRLLAGRFAANAAWCTLALLAHNAIR